MGVWEYGLVKEVCLLEEEVCLGGMHSTVSIRGRSINNNNNNNDNNNDHRDGDHNIDDVVGEEEVKVTEDVVVEGW